MFSTRKPAYLKLINTDIIDHIYDAKNSDKYYIRWIYNNLCLYPSSEGFVLSMPTRDRVIQSLVKDGVIELCNHQQMSADGIIWGWYVNFKYNDQCFVWCPDKYIYLTDENYNTIIRDEKQQTDTDKYYCYMPSDRDEPDLILNELTNLVKCITDRTKDL